MAINYTFDFNDPDSELPRVREMIAEREQDIEILRGIEKLLAAPVRVPVVEHPHD